MVRSITKPYAKVLLILSIGILLTSCYYDKEGILYPETANCIPQASPSFQTDIKPILDARCNNCHAGTSPSAGIKLDSHANVLPYVADGSLLGSIKNMGSFSPMPKNSGKLSACEIQKIENWIKAGSINN